MPRESSLLAVFLLEGTRGNWDLWMSGWRRCGFNKSPLAHVYTSIFGQTDVSAAQYVNTMGVLFASAINICEY